MGTFGEWLREQRSQRRLTRDEFAKRIGCSVAMLRKMEDGERRPSAQIAGLIASCLEIPSEERTTFIEVARGELSFDRLPRALNPLPHPTNPLTETSSSPPIKLPVLPTPFIGRQAEVEQLCRILSDPQCRLLTLVGPGGIGKTRLAIETASQYRDDFADGVFFVPLAPIQFARLVVPVIAESIGFVFHSDPAIDPPSQLLHYLGEKQVLLVVDNLEHLLGDPAVIDLLAKLLTQADRIKLLITSRESLGLQGEWVFEVQGLPIPKNAEMEDTSMELFLQRARRAHVGFNATTEDYPAIVRICSLVNGMPLGIELAASWVRTLSCEEIASEIERGLDFLSVSAKDLPARHRSMRAVFDHSWKLLSEEEQDVLLRLSIFQGGFSREATQQVAGANLPMLSVLVTKSLIRRNRTGRYDLHELIRQYALDQLSNRPKVQKEALAKHGRYYMNFLSQQDLPLRSSVQRESLAELLTDIDNIRNAMEWALMKGEFVLIESAVRAYSTLFDTLGWTPEALDTLGRINEVLEAKTSLSRIEQVALAHVLTSRSLFAYRASQYEQAHVMLNRSLEILRSLHEPRVLVEALTFLGIITLTAGDLMRAMEYFKEGLKVATDIHDVWYEALCLTEVAGVNLFMGQVSGASEQFQSAMKAWRRTGDLRFTAFGLNYWSIGAIASGRYEEAQAALEESVEINKSVGDRWGLGISYRGLGLVAQAQGNHSSAIDGFQQSLQIFTELGSYWDIARVLSEIGHSTLAIGNYAEAEYLWQRSLKLAIETQGMLTAMDALVGFASLYARRGYYQHALQLLHFTLNHPSTIQETKARAERLFSEVSNQLSTQEIESARKCSEEKSLESVIDEIFQGSEKPAK
jgi:predicted ATPase/transcriptional regulator with XRE-family HTH domain/Tfp pilus assembly protein PilF